MNEPSSSEPSPPASSGGEPSPIAQLFDAVADGYDAQGVDFFGPIAGGLVDALAPKAGERALDIGCGRGAALFRLAGAVGAEGWAAGIDLSPRMVELTRADAQRLGHDVDVRVGDAIAPDVPAASVDVVTASLVLFFLPDPTAALVSWRNLVVAGGRVGVSTFGPYDQRWIDTVDATLVANIPDQIADARTVGREGPFASDEGMEELLAGAGYTDVRTVIATVSPRFDDGEHWFRWSMTVGQRRFWAALPTDRFDTVKAEILAAVERCRTDDGRFGFDQQVRYTLGVNAAG